MGVSAANIVRFCEKNKFRCEKLRKKDNFDGNVMIYCEK